MSVNEQITSLLVSEVQTLEHKHSWRPFGLQTPREAVCVALGPIRMNCVWVMCVCVCGCISVRVWNKFPSLWLFLTAEGRNVVTISALTQIICPVSLKCNFQNHKLSFSKPLFPPSQHLPLFTITLWSQEYLQVPDPSTPYYWEPLMPLTLGFFLWEWRELKLMLHSF